MEEICSLKTVKYLTLFWRIFKIDLPRVLVVLSVGGVLVSAQFANAAMCQMVFERTGELVAPLDVLRLYEASQNLSRKVRDNAPFYWADARVRRDLLGWTALPEVLKAEVIVIGDLHSGNFSPLLVPGKGVLYTLFDVKDLGHGPALLDINRLALNTVAVASRRRVLSETEEVDLYREILTHYRDGLAATEYRLTESFVEALPSEKKFRRKLDRKAENKTDDDGVLETDGEMTVPLAEASARLGLSEAGIREALLESYRAHGGYGQILDAALSVRDRGGSKELMRILATFKTSDDVLVMKEFKEVGDSALSAFANQPEMATVRRRVAEFLDYDIEMQFPLTMIGETRFSMRDKKIESISVPYKQKTPEEFAFLMRLAKEHAVWVGTFHGRQLDQQAGRVREEYADALVENEVGLIENLRRFNRRHLEVFRSQPPVRSGQGRPMGAVSEPREVKEKPSFGRRGLNFLLGKQ